MTEDVRRISDVGGLFDMKKLELMGKSDTNFVKLRRVMFSTESKNQVFRIKCENVRILLMRRVS